MVEALGRALKDAVPEGLKDRVEEALKESVAVAAKGRRYVDHVRAHLDFSKDLESSSSKAAREERPQGGGRPRRRSSGRRRRRSLGRGLKGQEGQPGASRRAMSRRGRPRGPGMRPPVTWWSS